MLKNIKNSRGDTLIEVLFAISVFGLVVVGSVSIMNQGTAISQRALEITLVRNEIDAQAEALRFIHDSYVSAYPNVSDGYAAEWVEIVGKSEGVTQASDLGTCLLSLSSSAKPFAINTRDASLMAVANLTSTVSTYSQVRYGSTPTAEGIWIEAVPSASQSNLGYIDFHIRACWQSIGQTMPVTLGTIVRLYEPR